MTAPAAADGQAGGPGLTFSQLRVALLLVAVAAMACLMPAQADTFWHLRAGQDLFATGHVPMVETYSHTARGLPWPNHEWLWQALSYALYRAGGMPLLTAVGAACATLACSLSYSLARARPWVNFVLAVLGIPLATLVWALRPQIISLLLLMALMHLLVRRRWWAIPPLFLVWANFHGAVALGGVVLVAATVVIWFDDRPRIWPVLAATAAAGVATAGTPMGMGLWRFIGESMGRSRQNHIMEWLPSYPTGPIEISFWVAAVVLVALTWRRWRRMPSWEDRVVVAAALVMVPLAARAVRNISPFFLLWIPALSRLLRKGPWEGPLNPPRDGATPRSDVEHPRLNAAVLVLAVAGAGIAVAFFWARPLTRLGWRPLPGAAISAIQSCPGPLYNRYNEGGYLVWFVPRVPVFVDSRQDPYPAALLDAHTAAERSGDYQELFAQFQIRCAALPPQSRVAAGLVRAGWRQTFRDAEWMVLQAPVAR